MVRLMERQEQGWVYIKPQQNRAVAAEVQAEGNLSSTSTIASEQ
jgi:hypothetical protein